jgi:hypothetical protein
MVQGQLLYGTILPPLFHLLFRRTPGLKDQGGHMLAADTWSDASTGTVQVPPAGAYQWDTLQHRIMRHPWAAVVQADTRWIKVEACSGTHNVQARQWHNLHLHPHGEDTCFAAGTCPNRLLTPQQPSRCTPCPNPASCQPEAGSAENSPATSGSTGRCRW